MQPGSAAAIPGAGPGVRLLQHRVVGSTKEKTMKYFTPPRYVALQDFSSDEAMNRADADWEQAGDRYDAYYRSVQEQLPAGFRKLVEGYYLHDAIVREIVRQGNELLVLLQLDPPPRELLLLRYHLAGDPVIDREALPEPHRSQGPVEWMHDEVELLDREPTRCIHSVLLSNGWEARVPFHDVQVEPAEPILPPGDLASAGSCSR
jgi:hypothetical protein